MYWNKCSTVPDMFILYYFFIFLQEDIKKQYINEKYIKALEINAGG